jgi:hypothetical protein
MRTPAKTQRRPDGPWTLLNLPNTYCYLFLLFTPGPIERTVPPMLIERTVVRQWRLTA